jgi:hypothetical protein
MPRRTAIDRASSSTVEISRVPCLTKVSGLLERVLRNAWLQEEFLRANSPAEGAEWKPAAVRNYKAQVDGFLETRLLPIHLTAG